MGYLSGLIFGILLGLYFLGAFTRQDPPPPICGWQEIVDGEAVPREELPEGYRPGDLVVRLVFERGIPCAEDEPGERASGFYVSLASPRDRRRLTNYGSRPSYPRIITNASA